MESESYAPHGLWSFSIDHFMEKLTYLKINVLRLPFSVWLVINDPSNTNVDCSSNSQTIAKFGDARVCDLSALDLMEHLVDVLADNGILVLLDQHRLHGGAWTDIDNWITPLWYDDTFSEAQVLQSWDILMDRFAGQWNVMGLDLKNEPRDPASWGYNDTSTDWNQAAERIIQHIAGYYPSFTGLFFVEGVAENADSPTSNSYSHWWGGNLEGIHWYPISTGDSGWDERVVYSPHTYGPDVYDQSYFQYSSGFPTNLPTIWDLHFGFVEDLTGHPIVTGEWGGMYGSGPTGDRDVEWHDTFASYLVDNCMSDNFYWCLNPNSGDTGGLLNDDWSTYNDAKVVLIATVQPNPSKLAVIDGQYCFTAGERANAQCGDASSSNSTTTATTSTTSTITTNPTTTCTCTCTTEEEASTTTTSVPATTSTTSAATTTITTTTSQTTSTADSATTTTTTTSQTGIQVSTVVQSSWTDQDKTYTNIKIVLTNNAANSVSQVRIQLSPQSLVIDSYWVLVWEDESQKIFTYPNWLNVNANGGKYDGAGLVYVGDTPPTFVVLGYQ